MNTLSIHLENCYGISFLNAVLNFKKGNAIGIYAANGTMKTSLAKTFDKLSKGEEIEELIYNQIPTHSILFNEVAIEQKEIFVVHPFVDNYQSKNVHNLLVDEESKLEFDEINNSITSLKSKFFTKLNKTSGIKKDDIEQKLLTDFSETSIFSLLSKIDYSTIEKDYSHLKYDTLFSKEVLELLTDPTFQKNITEYITTYNTIVSSYSIFKKGVFTPNKAETVANTLKKENFFKAGNMIKLAGESDNIEDEDLLLDKISTITKDISENPQLKILENKITKNLKVIYLKEVIEAEPYIIAELKNLSKFKKKIWVCYLKQLEESIKELLEQYNDSKEKIEEIECKANQQKPIWDSVISTFKGRFYAPYKEIIVRNKVESILGKELPNIIFHFQDNVNNKECFLSQKEILSKNFLSMGEKRSLYLLNIIYEVEVRRRSNQKTVFIFDDVADSFDYKNKYAIIQYLKEISEYDNFFVIILTHNFDFFRTIQDRVVSDKWKESFIAIKQANGNITLKEGGHKKTTEPFSVWVKEINCNSGESLKFGANFPRNRLKSF